MTDMVREVSQERPMRVFPSNGQWIALVGPNLLDGVFEVGATVDEAVAKLAPRLVLRAPGVALCTGAPISTELP